METKHQININENRRSCVTAQNLTFYYPGRIKPALSNINTDVKKGDFILLCGSSGCGKTTFLRHLKPALSPHGRKSGRVFFNGTLLSDLDNRTAAAKIGYVFQDPENQIVTDKVRHELAFGGESLGLDSSVIHLRVSEIASFFGITSLFHKDITELSGGQKQLLALASIVTLQPDLLILDEPTSQLDPIAAADFLSMVERINRELGITVLLTEHRTEEVFHMCTRVLLMEDGKIICDDIPNNIGQTLRLNRHKMFAAMPVPVRIRAGAEAFSSDLPQLSLLSRPVTVKEGREWLTKLLADSPSVSAPQIPDKTAVGNRKALPTVKTENLWFKYERNLPDVIKGLSFKAYSGEITAILGGNGTGKTTTLSLISGLLTPYRGKVLINGENIAKISKNRLFNRLIGFLPQNPRTLFVSKTVSGELSEMLKDMDISRQESRRKFEHAVSICRLQGLENVHPYDLSGGEQQRAALAKVLLTEPKIFLADEPTKGLDADYKKIFAEILNTLKKNGAAIIMVSHDIEFCAEYADRCALFFDGSIVTENTPAEFFSGNTFYTTAANRMSRHILPRAITVNNVLNDIKQIKNIQDSAVYNDVSDACCQQNKDLNNDFSDDDNDNDSDDSNNCDRKNDESQIDSDNFRHPGRHKLNKRTLSAAAVIFLLIPLTFAAWQSYFSDNYNIISLLLIFETMIPFIFIFEKRKPRAGELVVLAVLCAIGVAGRTAFFMLQQFKPVTAIVIIAGVAFGAEAGFLTGAITGFVSNIFFGHGYWTPWQMVAFGIIGFLAGLIFKKGYMVRSHISLCLFGGLATFILYGGIMNSASVLMYQSHPTASMFVASCLQGVYFDAIHASATVFFLAVAGKPMLEKLNRVKEKYGLIRLS